MHADVSRHRQMLCLCVCVCVGEREMGEKGKERVKMDERAFRRHFRSKRRLTHQAGNRHHICMNGSDPYEWNEFPLMVVA